MSGLFASLSVGWAWDKLTSFIRAFSAPSASAPSSSRSQQEEDQLEELRKMERTMRRLRAVLHDAEEHWNIREESSKLKLQELKEVAYVMEDVVDEYEYEVNRCKVEALEQYASANKKRKRQQESPANSKLHELREVAYDMVDVVDKYEVNRSKVEAFEQYVSANDKRKRQEQNEVYPEDMGVVAVPAELVNRAAKITARFNEIIDFSDRFALSENDGERRRFSHDMIHLRQTSSFVFEKSIIGRDKDRGEIVAKLLTERNSVESPVSIMVIVGMAGLGKTTLAQLVYNSPRVRQSFDKRAWVCVSEDFNVGSITRKIINSLTGETHRYTELVALQEKLADEMKDKNVLLVLDDVWNERRDCWDLLCAPMSAAAFCQILVTTRSVKIAKLVQTVPMYHLNYLTSGESWSLFKHVAFATNQESNTTCENLIEIGKRIAQKCKGLPLAIITVGSMLRYETDEKIWEDVLENELFDLEQTRNQVLPVLELCYKHMPVYLRRCFIALSLYPKDSALEKGVVIRLWKLLDLLNFNGSEDEEQTGRLCFKELVQRSILQDKKEFLLDVYSMHDLVHDLACFLSAGEFHRLEGDTLPEIPQNVRYMSVPFGYQSDKIPVLPHSLRAFLIFCSSTKIRNPESVFLSCKNLRALLLTGNSFIEALPSFTGSLKLIRHLRLDGWFGKSRSTISISLCQLYNLETLEYCAYLEPRGIALREVGHLVNLHNLSLRIHRCGCSCNIKELKSINKVRDLTIKGLGNISCIEDANEAHMRRKRQVQSLKLDFAAVDAQCQHFLKSGPATLSHDQLLGSLQPYHSLTELHIENYESHKYPGWLGNGSFSKLTKIRLFKCGSKHLPPLGGLPSLKDLTIMDVHNVEHIGREFISCHPPNKGFPSLTYMSFDHMKNLLEWSGVNDGDFDRLETLSISNCSKLKSLPVAAPFLSLESFILFQCHGFSTIPAWYTLRKLNIFKCDGLSDVPSLPSLLELYLKWCPMLRAVGSQPLLTSMILNQINLSSVAFDSLPSLTHLEISDFIPGHGKYGEKNVNLKYDLCSPYHDLPSLKSLKIQRHPVTCLHLIQQGLPSLTRLCLCECPYLQYCDGLAGLTSLQHLEVRGCPELPTDSLHLPQLKTLVIEDC